MTTKLITGRSRLTPAESDDFRIDPNTLAGKRAIENAAILAHEANRAYCAAMGDPSQGPWMTTMPNIQASAVAGVQQIVEDPATTAEQSHESWCKFKVADGWIYGTEKNAEAKTHPCLVPYQDLPAFQRHKDAIFGAVVREALYIYQERTFFDQSTKLDGGSVPYKASDPSKQHGLVLTIGRATRLCYATATAYLEATEYPVGGSPISPLDVTPQMSDMVLYCLTADDVETAYDWWRRTRYPEIHPDFPTTGDVNSSAGTIPAWFLLQYQRLWMHWHLLFGVAQAVKLIEGLTFERPVPASSFASSWYIRHKGKVDDAAVAMATELMKAAAKETATP